MTRTELKTVKRSSADQFRRWKGGINYAELARAREFFEVSLPVEIKRANGIVRRGGYRFRAGTHVITVSTYVTVEEANQALLHELAHAAQCERYGSYEKLIRAYVAETEKRKRAARNVVTVRGAARTVNRAAYVRNEFEEEARAASEFTDDFRVAK